MTEEAPENEERGCAPLIAVAPDKTIKCNNNAKNIMGDAVDVLKNTILVYVSVISLDIQWCVATKEYCRLYVVWQQNRRKKKENRCNETSYEQE